MRITQGLFGFGKKKEPVAPLRFQLKRGAEGTFVVDDTQTGLSRTFKDHEAAKLFQQNQNQIHTLQQKVNEGPGWKARMKDLGWTTAKVAVPLAAAGAVRYGWRKVNKKAGLGTGSEY